MQGTISIVANFDGNVIQGTIVRSGNGVNYHEIPLPAAQAGNAAWGGSSGVITFLTAHGLTTSNKVGVFWGSGSRRLGMTISAADTYTITVTNSTGSGTALPTTSTAAVTVGLEVDCPDMNFNESDMTLF